LQKAAGEMLDWHDGDMSVMEMSHRGKEFISIADRAEADLRTLLQTLDGVVKVRLWQILAGRARSAPGVCAG
jgi:phosphoserine aminotransferase